MSSFKEPNLPERQNAAVNAKKAALEKFRAKTVESDAKVAERQTARAAARNDTLLASEARDVAEQAARDVAVQAERKTARDARYAARTARK